MSGTAPTRKKTGPIGAGMRPGTKGGRPGKGGLGLAPKVGLVFIAGLVLLALVGDLLVRTDPNAQDLLRRMESPSGDHWLGTDAYGRDTLARLIAGARLTLVATLQAVGTAVVLGIPLGLVAGYAGGIVDAVLGRIADSVMSVPTLILALAIVGILGPGLTNAMIAVGIVFAPRFFRVARGAASGIRNEPYIEACQAIGCSPARILLRHMLPNASGPLLIQTTYSLGLVVIAEASLSFLGLGVQAPDATWGGMTREAFGSVSRNGFPMLPPLLMIFLTILAFSMVGDGIRDRLTRGRDGKRI
ncbi:ABC transporter permease [Polymorphospora sp. NPDC051019]|uniref:ABC transporter permease n=1 Tax=Polymorphospora sp. NPDC051019 TaxID=3155725 RepID=UPI003426BB4B